MLSTKIKHKCYQPCIHNIFHMHCIMIGINYMIIVLSACLWLEYMVIVLSVCLTVKQFSTSNSWPLLFELEKKRLPASKMKPFRITSRLVKWPSSQPLWKMFLFLYTNLQMGCIMVWWCPFVCVSICPSRSPSTRSSVQSQFSKISKHAQGKSIKLYSSLLIRNRCKVTTLKFDLTTVIKGKSY